jgi:chromosome partitioning protein
MKVALINGKGGAGKTTVSILLGCALAEAGKVVAIHDTDPQRTASQWVAALGDVLRLAGTSDGDVIIDTPPRLDSPAVVAAIHSADVVIVPTSPSPADLFTSRDTVDLLRCENAIAKTRLLFNQVQPGTVLSRDLDDFAARIGLEPLKSRIQRRQAYQHAVVSGWKFLPAEARDEVFRVALEVVTANDSRSNTVRSKKVGK